MPNLRRIPVHLLACLAAPLTLFALQAKAQSGQAGGAQSLNLVLPTVPGMLVTQKHGMRVQDISMSSDSSRIILTLTDGAGTTASSILFPNESHTDASACRDSVMNSLRKTFTTKFSGVTMASMHYEDRTSANGQQLKVVVFIVPQVQGAQFNQRNLLAFAANRSTCAEVHLSKVLATEADDSTFDQYVKQMKFEPAYTTTTDDYFSLATILFRRQQYAQAATYYKSALAIAGTGNAARDLRRLLTDQLTLSYGMSGETQLARQTAQTAITADPDYAMSYYLLACADADSKDLDAARTHLEQAFARKTSLLPGESLPVPQKDSSFTPYRSNLAFWKFLGTLH